MFKAVVFLGNPGPEHKETRHNVAWKLADCCNFLAQLGWVKKFKGVYAVQVYNGKRVYFLKPLTFMNKSGESVQQMMHFFKITASELLVVCDDVELDFGRIDVKKGGSLEGHNGLKSIAQRLGTRDFYRLRVGISRPDNEDELTSYVLGKFKPEEQEALPILMDKISKSLETLLERGTLTAIKKLKNTNLLE